MASWLKKIKKKLAAFLAIIALLSLLIAIPVMVAFSAPVAITIAVGVGALGVGVLAFLIDKEAAVAAFSKVGDGIAAVGGAIAEGVSKTLGKVVDGAASGLLSSPVMVIGLCVGGYLLYDYITSEEGEKENVTIELNTASEYSSKEEYRSIEGESDRGWQDS